MREDSLRSDIIEPLLPGSGDAAIQKGADDLMIEFLEKLKSGNSSCLSSSCCSWLSSSHKHTEQKIRIIEELYDFETDNMRFPFLCFLAAYDFNKNKLNQNESACIALVEILKNKKYSDILTNITAELNSSPVSASPVTDDRVTPASINSISAAEIVRFARSRIQHYPSALHYYVTLDLHLKRLQEISDVINRRGDLSPKGKPVVQDQPAPAAGTDITSSESRPDDWQWPEQLLEDHEELAFENCRKNQQENKKDRSGRRKQLDAAKKKLVEEAKRNGKSPLTEDALKIAAAAYVDKARAADKNKAAWPAVLLGFFSAKQQEPPSKQQEPPRVQFPDLPANVPERK